LIQINFGTSCKKVASFLTYPVGYRFIQRISLPELELALNRGSLKLANENRLDIFVQLKVKQAL